MNKLINDPANVVADALRGVAAAHPELRVDHEHRIVYRGDAKKSAALNGAAPGGGRTAKGKDALPPLAPGQSLVDREKLRVPPGTSEQALAAVFERAYADAPFVRLTGTALPEIKHVVHTNFCDIGWRVDASGRAIVVSVIDNLLKGASGQAVQNMNVMVGLDERSGLL